MKPEWVVSDRKDCEACNALYKDTGNYCSECYEITLPFIYDKIAARYPDGKRFVSRETYTDEDRGVLTIVSGLKDKEHNNERTNS